MINDIYKGSPYFSHLVEEEKKKLDAINKSGWLVELFWVDEQERIKLVELIYKGKGKYRSFQGYIIWDAFIGSIKNKRVYINLYNYEYASPRCVEIAKSNSNTIVRRDININIYRLFSE